MRNLIDFLDLTPSEWEDIYRRFEEIVAHPEDFRDAARGRVMGSLFFEPSTRTSFSFQAAMQRLGGSVFGFNDPGSTSVAKGETLKDTIIMCSGYADLLVMRHPREGAAAAAALYSRVPIVNAGDGGHWHPTQTLTDLCTLRRLRGTLDGLSIGLCGDLRHGRTVHSLIRALSRSHGIQFYLVSPRTLSLPGYLRKFMKENNMRYIEVSSLDAHMPLLDVLYMTRIQRERFSDKAEYEKHRGVYILDSQKLKNAKQDLTILHPLPRVDEIRPDVDDDPRACYFEQARLGMYARMSLLSLLLERCPATAVPVPPTADGATCENSLCVTENERYLPPLRLENGGCYYCEHG